MYRCCRVKRFLLLLVCDALGLGLLCLLFNGFWHLAAPATNAAPEESHCVPILMYHSVFHGRTGDYIVSEETFTADLQYLKEHGYHTVMISDLIAYVYDGKPLPERPVVLTFDDGFYNNYSIVLPLLERFDMCATVSVVGCFMEAQAEADAHQDNYSYLTIPEIRALSDSGRVEIGNHTYNLHSNGRRTGCAIRRGESEAEYAALFNADVGQLQSLLTKEAGITPVVFAYPFGFLCKESIPLLKSMGFLATLNCFERPNLITRNPDCLYGLCRYNRPGGISTDAFMARALKGTGLETNQLAKKAAVPAGTAAWRAAPLRALAPL